MTETYIYALCDPHTDERRYIGKTIQPKMRLFQHLTQGGGPRGAWLAKLKRLGLQPKMMILETVPNSDDARERELHWIRKCLKAGCKLTNNRGDLRLATKEQIVKMVFSCTRHEKEDFKLACAILGTSMSAVIRQAMESTIIEAGYVALAIDQAEQGGRDG